MKTWESYKKEIKSKKDGTYTDVVEMEEMVKIIKKISLKREKLGLSQRTLANMCNMPQSTIARIETFKTSPTLDTLVKITKELGLKLAIL